jgi:hypothetical protein
MLNKPTNVLLLLIFLPSLYTYIPHSHGNSLVRAWGAGMKMGPPGMEWGAKEAKAQAMLAKMLGCPHSFDTATESDGGDQNVVLADKGVEGSVGKEGEGVQDDQESQVKREAGDL